MVQQSPDKSPQSRRVQYRAGSCPRFVTLLMTFSVSEITEQRVTITGLQQDLLALPPQVIGVILFSDGSSLRVDGAVKYQSGETAYIQLTRQLPESLLAHEFNLSSSSVERRRYFRLRYSTGEGPVLIIENVLYEVLELSELGLVFRLLPQGEPFTIGQSVRGSIKFVNGIAQPIAGVILRTRMAERVVYLSVKSLPAQVIFQEQRRVIALRHPI